VERPEGSRILAVDYGERRIGLAISDQSGTIASGLETLRNSGDAIDRLRAIVSERGVVRVVVGLPLTLAGQEGDSARKALAFAEKLRAAIGVPVEMLDERFTSSMAEQTIRDMGIGRKKRRDKSRIDEIAAVILLQDYLNMKGRNREAGS
jgi:putative holliday junction resolvase